MAKKKKKEQVKKLQIIESFLQFNYEKSYKVIDFHGNIIDNLMEKYPGFYAQKKGNSLDAYRFPEKTLDLRITSESFWTKGFETKDFPAFCQRHVEDFEIINEFADIQKIQRFGFRNKYFYKDGDTKINELLAIGGYNTESYKGEIKSGEYTSILNVVKAGIERQDGSTATGLSIDIDTGIDGETDLENYEEMLKGLVSHFEDNVYPQMKKLLLIQ